MNAVSIFPFQGGAQHIGQDLCQSGTRSGTCSIPIMYRTFSHAIGLPDSHTAPLVPPQAKDRLLLALNNMASMIGTPGPQSDAIRVDPGKRGR